MNKILDFFRMVIISFELLCLAGGLSLAFLFPEAIKEVMNSVEFVAMISNPPSFVDNGILMVFVIAFVFAMKLQRSPLTEEQTRIFVQLPIYWRWKMRNRYSLVICMISLAVAFVDVYYISKVNHYWGFVFFIIMFLMTLISVGSLYFARLDLKDYFLKYE